MGLGKVATLIASAMLLSGCAIPLLAGLTLNEFNTGTSIISTSLTGKGLADHALSLATRSNCNLIGGLLRNDRALCEKRGSEATLNDFNGLIGLLADVKGPPTGMPDVADGIVLSISYPETDSNGTALTW